MDGELPGESVAGLHGGPAEPYRSSWTRTPPRSIEAEQALLGAILVNNRAWERVADFLQPEHFADPMHGAIFEGMTKLLRDGRHVDGTTMAAVMRDDPRFVVDGKKHGVEYLAGLMHAAVTVVNAHDYGRVIFDMHRRREIILYAEALQNRAYNVDLEETAEEMVANALNGVEGLYRGGGPKILSAREVRVNAIEGMHKPAAIYSTGFPRLDKAMGGGLYPGKAYGFQAKFKVGKTAFVGTISHHLNLTGVKHLYATGEMGGEQIEQRSWAQEMGINSLAFVDPAWRDNPTFLRRAAEFAVMAKDNLFYADTAGVGFEQFQNFVTASVLRHQCVGFVVDYLQLIGGKPKAMSTAEHLDIVSQWIADVCARRKLWSMVLIQENQEGSTRGGTGPLMAFDQGYSIHRNEDDRMAWLTMRISRYTKSMDIGTESLPGYELMDRVGPYYRELPGVDPDEPPAQEEIPLR